MNRGYLTLYPKDSGILSDNSEIIYEGIVNVTETNEFIKMVGIRSGKEFKMSKDKIVNLGDAKYAYIKVDTDEFSGHLNECIQSIYTPYDTRWIQPGSKWWYLDTSMKWIHLNITFRRSNCIFYTTDDNPKEDYFGANSFIARTAIPEKFFINEFYKDCEWTFQNSPAELANKLCKFEYVKCRADIPDKAYEYCYQRLMK